MSRKHFQALADAIKTIESAEERRRVAELVARVCASQNQHFSYSRFYAACGVE